MSVPKYDEAVATRSSKLCGSLEALASVAELEDRVASLLKLCEDDIATLHPGNRHTPQLQLSLGAHMPGEVRPPTTTRARRADQVADTQGSAATGSSRLVHVFERGVFKR